MLEIVQSVRVGERFRGQLERLVEEGLQIRPGEGTRTALLFSHLMLASAVFTMGRTVRDTLFLSRYPLSALPFMYVAYGLASAVTAVIYGRLARRWAHDRAIATWCGVGIASYLGTWSLVRAELGFIYPVFYVWSEVFANLALSQFWALANDLHDARSGKRLFATIGAARVLGAIVVGLASASIVHLLGTPQLLFVLCGLLVGIALLARRLAREPRPHGKPRTAQKKRARAHRSLLADPYVLALSGMVLSTFAALTIGDYQFKAIARANYREDGLAQFFSFFHAGTGVIAFAFQLLVTPRLLRRYGVGVGMTVMPVVFGIASALLLVTPSLALACLLKFADNGLQYTLHDTTLQALYVPFSAEAKARARAFLDVVVKPIAYGLGGLVVALFASRGSAEFLGVAGCAIVFGWLTLVPTVRARYAARLTSTLRVGGLSAFASESPMDAARKRALVQTLANPDARLVLAALDELNDDDDPDASAALLRLCRSADASMRVAALTRIGALPRSALTELHERTVVDSLRDAVPEVRAAAAVAYARLREDEAVNDLVPLLDDASDVVRSATLSGLLSYCGFEGAMVGGKRFSELLTARDPEDREAAARALGGIGRSGARRLIPLLEDPDPNVRLAAAASAHAVRDPRLVPALIRSLGDRRTRAASIGALSAMGAPAVVPLVRALASPTTPRELRLTIPRILRRIQVESSYTELLRFTSERDSVVRLAVFSALSRLRRKLELAPAPLEAVRSWIDREIRETVRLAASYAEVRSEVGTALLDGAVAFSQQRGILRVLRILELRCAHDPLRLVRDRIDEPAHRANALEVLDAELEPSLRPLVLTFLDDAPVMERARRLGIHIATTGDEVLLSRLNNPNPYSVLCALDAARVHRRSVAIEPAKRLLAHESQFVREGAMLLLAELDAEGCAADIERLTQDKDPKTAAFAHHTLVKLGLLALPPGDTMLSTVEKLLLLRTTPMFEKLRGDDLLPLAHVAEVENYAQGEVIFDEGEPGDALFVVIRGAVAISKGGKVLARLGKNEAFGEMSVLDEGPRSAGARASEDTEVLRIGSVEFADVLHDQVEIAEGVIRVLSKRLRETNAALEKAGRDPTERRGSS